MRQGRKSLIKPGGINLDMILHKQSSKNGLGNPNINKNVNKN